VTSGEKGCGIIDEQEIIIHVRKQADGNAPLEFNIRDPEAADLGLAGRVLRACDSRLGRKEHT
jgi:hypothetical protein